MASFPIIGIISAICLTLLLGGCKSACGFVVGHQSLAAQEEFDYFILVQQWPPTYCNSQTYCCEQNGCCRGEDALPKMFTLNGLWANYDDGSYPKCCEGPKFDANEILPMSDVLNKYWPTYTCGNATTCNGEKGLFWASQWEQHGTCSFPVVQDQDDYFTKTLYLYFNYNVTDVLRKDGIVPSNHIAYSLARITSVIKSAFDIIPEITCKSDSIQQVRLCFYKDFKPRDCNATASLKNSCPKFVSLSAYTTSTSTKFENGATTAAWAITKESFA